MSSGTKLDSDYQGITLISFDNYYQILLTRAKQTKKVEFSVTIVKRVENEHTCLKSSAESNKKINVQFM